MSNNIICRKCGGNHFTAKCGKDNNNESKFNNINKASNNTLEQRINNSSKERFNNSSKERFNNSSKERFNDNFRKTNYKKNTEIIFRVQMSNLPLDMTETEMKELLYRWGEITKIKVINYEETSVAYIDFKYKEQSEHFINALDKTSFDNNTIYINSVKSY
jgi:RNA recognition motif-containing protein